ncbi:short-chain dehydrogenase [Xylariaceae sp. FL0255]|nr:short-chain dehydrogenase [Xylariaceae sp. FL0255]
MTTSQTQKSIKWTINDEIPDLSGKVALVTGANSPGGLGFHTAYQLASKNAKVYIGARSISKAESAIREMAASNPDLAGNGRLVPFVADLGDLRAVKAAGEKLAREGSKLDILVHNAAVHLGPFTLTKSVMPFLRTQPKPLETLGLSRYEVSASSFKVLPPGIRFDSPDSFNAEMEPTVLGGTDFTRYSLSKLAKVLFARELQKKFDAANIQALSMSLHPGLFNTDGVIKWLQSGQGRTLDGRLTLAEGAAMPLFATTSPKVLTQRERFKGAFLVPPGEIEALVGDAGDEKLAKELWATSERVIETLVE